VYSENHTKLINTRWGKIRLGGHSNCYCAVQCLSASERGLFPVGIMLECLSSHFLHENRHYLFLLFVYYYGLKIKPLNEEHHNL
jgi:hypothetical protein